MGRVKIEIRKYYYLVYYEWRKIYIGNSSCYADGIYLCYVVKELKTGFFDGRRWIYHERPVYNVDVKAAEKYEQQFVPKERKYQPSQELFYIQSHMQYCSKK